MIHENFHLKITYFMHLSVAYQLYLHLTNDVL